MEPHPHSAGMPSKRLSDLFSDSISSKKAVNYNYGSSLHTFNILYDYTNSTNNEISTDNTQYELNNYAGMTSKKLNERCYGPSCKQNFSRNSNSSANITSLFSNKDDNYKIEVRRRNLKHYYPSSHINEAFCTKYQVVDNHTGRSSIMAARKPGKANAEVNIADFDAYQHRLESGAKTKCLENGIEVANMGMTAKEDKSQEAKRLTILTPISYTMRADNICCNEDWVVPNNQAKVEDNLGKSKRKYDCPWAINM